MKKTLLIGLLGGLVVSACTHDVSVRHDYPAPVRANVTDRTKVAHATCEAQYNASKQNYLSAVQSVIAKNNQHPELKQAPLDRFRAEINAAYNTVVARCKTHTHCLEVQGYDEARCYMAASDRKDAERRFSDIAERLREIENDADIKRAHAKHKKHKKGGTRVTVETTVNQSNKQKQKTHVGDEIEDQDVLILCGDAGNLLDRRCRKPCEDKGC